MLFTYPVTLVSHSVEWLLAGRKIDGTLSSISDWCKADISGLQRDVPNLTEEDWAKSLQPYIPLMISVRDRGAEIDVHFPYVKLFIPKMPKGSREF